VPDYAIVLDLDFTLWKPPISSDEFIVGVIANYMGRANAGQSDMLAGRRLKRDTPIRRWVEQHPDIDPDDAYLRMFDDGTIVSRYDALSKEDLYDAFAENREAAGMGKDARALYGEPARKVLEQLSGPRTVWTANTREYAERVLRDLGLRDCFDKIFTRDDNLSKVERSSYEIVKEQLPVARVFYVDENVLYLELAQSAGLVAIHAHQWAPRQYRRVCEKQKLPCAPRLEDLQSLIESLLCRQND
jgi:FMN phosphatase YigB (HAD superfamily)